MFGTIRRHQSWLYPIFAVIIILPFLAYFNPASRGGGGGLFGFMKGGQSPYGVIACRTVTAAQYDNAAADILLPFVMSGRQRPDPNSPEMKYEIYQRLFLQAKADQL